MPKAALLSTPDPASHVGHWPPISRHAGLRPVARFGGGEVGPSALALTVA